MFPVKTGAFSVNSGAVGNFGAGESSTHDVNFSFPRFPIKGANVIPDWESGQDSVSLPLKQYGSGVRFNLDSTNAGMSEKHSAEDTSPCSCKKV
jgi:hypothetical protein